ncbi:hypothetical protein D3C81_1094730 [compost metagenome]
MPVTFEILAPWPVFPVAITVKLPVLSTLVTSMTEVFVAMAVMETFVTFRVSTTVEVAEPLPSLTCSFSKPGPLTSVIVAVSALPSL